MYIVENSIDQADLEYRQVACIHHSFGGKAMAGLSRISRVRTLPYWSVPEMSRNWSHCGDLMPVIKPCRLRSWRVLLSPSGRWYSRWSRQRMPKPILLNLYALGIWGMSSNALLKPSSKHSLLQSPPPPQQAQDRTPSPSEPQIICFYTGCASILQSRFIWIDWVSIVFRALHRQWYLSRYKPVNPGTYWFLPAESIPRKAEAVMLWKRSWGSWKPWSHSNIKQRNPHASHL